MNSPPPSQQPPFISRELRFEVTECLNYKGGILTPLNHASVESIAGRLEKVGVKAVAICLLDSYANAAHEAECAAILRELLTGVPVTGSSEITREWRDFERTRTAVLNVYVQPVGSQRRATAPRLISER